MIDLIEAVGAALSSAASMVELAVNMKNSDLQHRIADLNVQLANIKNGVAGLQNANSELQDEVARLKADRSGPLVFNQENGFYYAKDEPAPYCPHCYETQKKAGPSDKGNGKMSGVQGVVLRQPAACNKALSTAAFPVEDNLAAAVYSSELSLQVCLKTALVRREPSVNVMTSL